MGNRPHYSRTTFIPDKDPGADLPDSVMKSASDPEKGDYVRFRIFQHYRHAACTLPVFICIGNASALHQRMEVC